MRILVAIMLAAAGIVRAAEPLEARWEGEVRIPGRDLHVVIDLAKSGETEAPPSCRASA